LLLSCTTPIVKHDVKEGDKVLTKKELLAKSATKEVKKVSRLETMFDEIMTGEHNIDEKVVDAERFADGTEVSKEWWIVTDNLGNVFKIYWENGILKDIKTIKKEKKKENKPLGG
jgi:hypothetical protein